jgi:protein-tyrosine phosphatase
MKPSFREGIGRAAKRLLPDAVLQEARKLRAYAPHERPIYLKLRISSRLGLWNPKISRAPKPARKILFVCFGNIMRSPMCEYLMNRELSRMEDPQFAVTSAGLNAIPGKPAHSWAVTEAREFGISLENHRARLLTREMVDQADAIFAMDYQNQVQILSRWPNAGKKLFMLAAYSSQEYRAVEISDPYSLGQPQTRICFDILNTCIQNLAASLSE